MNVDLSKIGIAVGLVTLLGTGATVVGKWFGIEVRVTRLEERMKSGERLNCAIANKLGVDTKFIEVCQEEE